MKIRIKNMLGILGFNLLLCGIGVFFIELIFGNWLKENQLNQLYLIHSRVISYDIKKLYPYHQTRIKYSRDTYGLRGDFSRPSEITILTVGGSTTDQKYINDGDTWQDVLAQNFAATGKRVVVANAGIDGQSSIGHIKNFDWWFPNIPDLHPKSLLFYVGINDFYTEAESVYDALQLSELTDIRRKIIRTMRQKSAIFYLIRTIQSIYNAVVAFKIDHRAVNFDTLSWTAAPMLSPDAYEPLMHTRLDAYALRLQVLCDKTCEMGAIPIFVTQPSRNYRVHQNELQGIAQFPAYFGTPINGLDYYYMMQKLDDVTMQICQKNQGICLHLAQEKELWQDQDFYDCFHMTPDGARKVGNYLFDALEENLYLQ